MTSKNAFQRYNVLYIKESKEEKIDDKARAKCKNPWKTRDKRGKSRNLGDLRSKEFFRRPSMVEINTLSKNYGSSHWCKFLKTECFQFWKHLLVFSKILEKYP